MRAVNLIPSDARERGSGVAGKSGGAVYVVLGGLAALAVMVALWATAGSRLGDDRAELSQLQSEAAAARAQGAQVASVDTIRALRTARVETVKTLASARIDWADSLEAIARTLPADTWLDAMSASVAPGSGPAGGSGGAGAVASSSPAPSIQISGCSPSQAKVALLMPRLRTVPGVDHVTLVSSTAADTAGNGAAAQGCTKVAFQMVLFFAPLVAPVVPGATVTPGATPAPGTTATPGTTTTPATPAPATAPATPVSQPTATTTTGK